MMGYNPAMKQTLPQALKALSDPVKAAFFPRFFKTGKGDYAEGDVFIGVTVPQVRSVAKRFQDLPLKDVGVLLQSPLHEVRLASLFLLVDRFKRSDDAGQKQVVDLYLKNLKFVNNWDLVDSSADKIFGAWLEKRDRSVLDRFARSKNLWERRMAIVSTFYFIRLNDFVDTFRIADLLLSDRHDLIHKAVGWMLREAGKRDRTALEKFLRSRYKRMPRTMLRYAIEKFTPAERAKILKGKW
jgi:3-methyladenine DNA glycosylase AlkD